MSDVEHYGQHQPFVYDGIHGMKLFSNDVIEFPETHNDEFPETHNDARCIEFFTDLVEAASTL